MTVYGLRLYWTSRRKSQMVTGAHLNLYSCFSAVRTSSVGHPVQSLTMHSHLHFINLVCQFLSFFSHQNSLLHDVMLLGLLWTTWNGAKPDLLNSWVLQILGLFFVLFIGPILDDRLKEKILKPWKGALSSHSVCLSVCLCVRLWTGYRSHLLA